MKSLNPNQASEDTQIEEQVADERLNKKRSRLLLLLLKCIPPFAAVCLNIGIFMSVFGVGTSWIPYICSLSLATWLFIWLCTYAFKFHGYHRTILYYLLTVNLVMILDYYISIPITDMQMVLLYVGITFVTLLILSLQYYRQLTSPKQQMVNHPKPMFPFILKCILIFCALCSGADTILICLGIRLDWLEFIGGLSLVTWIYLWIATYLFKFSMRIRLFLYYALLVNILNIFGPTHDTATQDHIVFRTFTIIVCAALFPLLCLYAYKRGKTE